MPHRERRASNTPEEEARTPDHFLFTVFMARSIQHVLDFEVHISVVQQRCTGALQMRLGMKLDTLVRYLIN